VWLTTLLDCSVTKARKRCFQEKGMVYSDPDEKQAEDLVTSTEKVLLFLAVRL
jgi:hypothetical protein